MIGRCEKGWGSHRNEKNKKIMTKFLTEVNPKGDHDFSIEATMDEEEDCF